MSIAALPPTVAPVFSLVLCTRGRQAEIGEFLESLVGQRGASCEVIVVDQNDDDRLVSVLAPYVGRFPLRHVRTDRRGASRARNVGIDLAVGGLIGFPDDDCRYLEGYLEQVARAFDEDPALGCITGHPTSQERWIDAAALSVTEEVTPHTVQDRCQEFTIFVRRAVLGDLRYNEALGVGAGTPWGADEGPDLLIRLMRGGCRVRYYRNLLVYHPDKIEKVSRKTLSRAASYARGRGCLMRLHPYPLRVVLRAVFRPAAGIGVYLLTLRPRRSAYYVAVVSGLLRGLFMSGSELAAARAGNGAPSMPSAGSVRGRAA